MNTVAVIGMDAEFCRALRSSLEPLNFRLEQFDDTDSASGPVASRDYAFVVAGTSYSADDAARTCDRLRSRRCPLIVLDRVDSDAVRIAALECGADDVVSRASAREVAARGRALLRRTAPTRAFDYCDGRMRIDLQAMSASDDGRRIAFSRGETEVLALLMSCAPAFLTVAEMCALLSGGAVPPLNSRTVEFRLKGLRTKLGSRYLECRPHFGYAFRPGSEHDLATLHHGDDR